MPKAVFEIRYDRRVSDAFLDSFTRGGAASRLNKIAHKAPFPLDLQMRRDPKTGAEWATLYVGLTAVLNVHYAPGRIRLSAHKTWSGGRFGFVREWSSWAPDSATDWDVVELYLERVIPKAARDHGMTEGAVQAVVSKSKNKDWAMLDREVTPSFADSATKSKILGQCMQPLVKVVAKAPVKHTARPARFGAECDLLALDRDGRILAIEVKPATSPGVAWVAGQAAMYARVLQEWIRRDATPDESTGYPGPRVVLEGMLAQRQALGHARGFNVSWAKDLIVTPVVVLQRGVAPVQRDYMLAVRDSLAKARIDQLQPVEIYEVSILGDFERVA